ncbi:MAG: hypothetical protein ABH832_01670 [bacterium]
MIESVFRMEAIVYITKKGWTGKVCRIKSGKKFTFVPTKKNDLPVIAICLHENEDSASNAALAFRASNADTAEVRPIEKRTAKIDEDETLKLQPVK